MIVLRSHDSTYQLMSQSFIFTKLLQYVGPLLIFHFMFSERPEKHFSIVEILLLKHRNKDFLYYIQTGLFYIVECVLHSDWPVQWKHKQGFNVQFFSQKNYFAFTWATWLPGLEIYFSSCEIKKKSNITFPSYMQI